MGWWLITAAMAAMTGPRERVSSQFSKHSWVCSVLSASYVIVHWLLHQSCMAWRSYTTCQGPHEPEVSSGRLLDQQPLQLWLFARCSAGPPPQSPQAPSLLSGTSPEWRGPETTCPSRVCAACLPQASCLRAQSHLLWGHLRKSLSIADSFSRGGGLTSSLRRQKREDSVFHLFWDLERAWLAEAGALAGHTLPPLLITL